MISGRIRLESEDVRAGALVHAELVLRNSSGHAIVLARGCPHGFVQLMLGNAKVTAAPAWAEPACTSASFVARAGTTVYRLEAPATYLSCTMVGHPPTAGERACLPGDRMPPLPVGAYTVSIVAVSSTLQRELAHIRPANVRLFS